MHRQLQQLQIGSAHLLPKHDQALVVGILIFLHVRKTEHFANANWLK